MFRRKTVDKYEAQTEDITLLIGKLRTPIKKAPRNKKKQIKAWVADSKNISVQSELLLRASLSIGENPLPHILQASTIIHALEPLDIIRYAKRLSLSSQTIEATAVFVGLQTALQESAAAETPSQLVRKIVASVKKWLKWVDSAHGNLTETTETALLDLILFLIRKVAPSKKLSGKKLEKFKKMILPLSDLSLGLVAKSLFPETLIRTMRLLRIISENVSISFLEEILEDDKRYQLLEEALGRMPTYVKKAAYDGRVDRLETMATSVTLIPSADLRFQAVIREIWDKKSAVLTDEVQKFIYEYLKIDQGFAPRAITLADRSEDLRIPQVASALLSSWEAREDSLKGAEAFKVLNAVAQKFFNLRICGEVGNVIEFDSRVHEFPGAPIGEGQVVIVRPWVEWTEGSRSKVIIRAIAEKSKQS